MTQYKVEIAFGSGYSTPAASRVWTNVSAYVEGSDDVEISRGRADEIGNIEPSQMKVTLDNTDGRFTPEKTTGAYYPNVKKGVPIRVTVTHNAVEYVRFVGYVDEWPVTWPDASDGRALVEITATSRTARLGRDAELRSTPEEEVALDGPWAHYPLSEAGGAQQASDTSGNARSSLRLAGTGPALAFGGATGPADGVGAVKFNGVLSPSAPTAFGQYLSTTLATAPACVSGFFTVAGFDGATTAILSFVSGGSVLALCIDSGGTLATIYQDGSGGVLAGPVVTDGGVHHFGWTSTGDIYVDGALINTMDPIPSWPRFTLGGTIEGTSQQYHHLNGSVAHLTFWSSTPTIARIMRHAESGLTGFAGDASGTRIQRYATYAGIAIAELALDTGSSQIVRTDTEGKTPIDLMQDVAKTENGVLYDGKSGNLTFKGRAARYNVASAFSLSATAQEVEADLQPKLDDQFLVNDFTATGTTGSARVIDPDSIDDYGYYRQTAELATDDEDELAAHAQWRVGLGKQPRLRYGTVAVDVTNSSTAQAAAVLAADIGTRFGLSGLPAQAPEPTADLFIEGYTESISATGHRIAFNTSPTYGYAGPVGVWQLDVNSLDGPHVLAL